MSEYFPTGGLYKIGIRHGESTANAAEKDRTREESRVGGYQPAVKLAEVGYRQASLFGGFAFYEIGKLLGRDDFIIVRYSSAPAVRTQETAETIRHTMRLQLPITINPGLRELCKGNRWLGGDEKRRRIDVETPAYYERRERQGWDFRPGRAWLGQIGLGRLSGAETAREAGARLAAWYDEIPPMSEAERLSGRPIVDIAVTHGLANRYGVATVLHRDPSDHSILTIPVSEADVQYNQENATAQVLGYSEPGVARHVGRILLPS